MEVVNEGGAARPSEPPANQHEATIEELVDLAVDTLQLSRDIPVRSEQARLWRAAKALLEAVIAQGDDDTWRPIGAICAEVVRGIAK